MAGKELDVLLCALEERDIDLDRDDVAWAFEAPETGAAVREWVQHFLSPACLLSREEWRFFESGDTAKPTAQATTRTTAPGPGRPLSDLDFEAAIESLERSTAAIGEQTSVLEAQKSALQALQARHRPSLAADQAQAERQRQLVQQRAGVEFEVTELAEVLQANLRGVGKRVDGAVAAWGGTVEKVLGRDDRVLEGLGRVVPRLSDDDGGNDGSSEAEIEKLCHALTALTAQEIRQRLDTVYLLAASKAPTTAADTSQQSDALRAELDELTAEIDSLSSMAVESAHRAPILYDPQTSRADSQAEKTRWIDYAFATLQHLTARLETLDEHTRHLYAQQNALSQIASALSHPTLLMTTASANPKRALTSTSRSQISHPFSTDPSTPNRLKPLRLVQANLPDPQPALPLLLRTLNLPTTTNPSVLHQALQTQALELRALGSAVEREVAERTAVSLGKTEEDIAALVGAVYRFSPYAEVRVVDEELEQGIKGLETGTAELGAQMRRVLGGT